MLTDLVPPPLRHALRERHRAHCLARAIRRLRQSSPGSTLAPEVLRDLVYGWNNPWSVQDEVIVALWAGAWESTGPILECGSGLSTLLLAVVAERRGIQFVSLEHDAAWYEHVVRTLARLGLDARVELTPLVHHADHDWYHLPDNLPTGFGLVVCDGPPGETFGGRHGLLPAVGDRLAPDCTILMDDAARPGEQGVLERWMTDYGTTHRMAGSIKPYAVVRVGARGAHRAD